MNKIKEAIRIFNQYDHFHGFRLRKGRCDDLCWIENKRYDAILRKKEYSTTVFSPWLDEAKKAQPFWGYETSGIRSRDLQIVFDCSDPIFSELTERTVDINNDLWRVLLADPGDLPIIMTEPNLRKPVLENIEKIFKGELKSYTHRQDLVDRHKTIERRLTQYSKITTMCNSILIDFISRKFGYREWREYGRLIINGRTYIFRKDGSWKLVIPPEESMPEIVYEKKTFNK